MKLKKEDFSLVEDSGWTYIGISIDESDEPRDMEQKDLDKVRNHILDNQRIVHRLIEKINKLDKFLKELEEAKKFQKEHDTLRIHPIAGLTEQSFKEELEDCLNG